MKTAKLHTLALQDAKTYLFAVVFVAGNLILPQLCHLVPNGGATLLPIYFFTLIAAYKYGIGVGMITAVASPLISYALTGMPVAGMLSVVLAKSVLLAVAAAATSRFSRSVSLTAVVLTVFAAQAMGFLAHWALLGSLESAVAGLQMGIPGILLQVFGGYALLKALAKL